MYLQTTRYIYLLLSDRLDRACVRRSTETSTTGHTTTCHLVPNRVSRSDDVPIVEPIRPPCGTGDPAAEPHLVRGIEWEEDPEMYETAIDGIADHTTADG